MDNDTLLDAFKQIRKSYYDIEIPSDIFKGDACKNFIDNHFTEGCKKEVLAVPFKRQWNKNGKHCHTVSLYLLGLLSEDYFTGYLKTKLNQLMNITAWYDFKYTWFLTSMYHDIASCIEKTQVKANSSERKRQLGFYFGMFNIQLTPYKYQPRKENVCLTRFSEELIKNYFCYRMDNNSFEHGIIGGYLLFDSFCKNFYEKTRNVEWKDDGAETIDGLLWRREHIDHAAYVADAIICHNLWLSYDDSTKEVYKEYGLTPLIISKGRGKNKLSIKDYPLQFVLCLLDTIEPVKRFEELLPQEVLSLVGVKFESSGLSIQWEHDLEKQPQFKNWKNGIQELQKWMSVEVKFDELEREFIIRFQRVGHILSY